jgi:hypothetical protein
VPRHCNDNLPGFCCAAATGKRRFQARRTFVVGSFATAGWNAAGRLNLPKMRRWNFSTREWLEHCRLWKDQTVSLGMGRLRLEPTVSAASWRVEPAVE